MLTLILAFQGIVCTQAQEGGVKFLENVTYAEALAQAKQAGKMLFIDCYTSWCGPCKMMVRDVFPQKSVGDYFNPKFVCTKFDMEKGEGIELKKKFGVRAFPTFLIIDAQTGKEITRIVGGSKAENFIPTVEKSLAKGGLSALQAKYEAGERDEAFVQSYIEALDGAYMSDECAKVVEEYLAGKDARLLQDEALFKLFTEHIKSPYNATFKYVWAHKDEFTQKYGEQVGKQLKMCWTAYPVDGILTRDKEGNASFDEKAMADYVALMEKEGIDNIDYIKLNTGIAVATAKGEWKEMLELAHQYDKTYKADDMLVYNWCLRLEQKCTDPALRSEAGQWIKERLKIIKVEAEKQKKATEEAIKKGEPVPAMSMTSGGGFKNAYEQLLAKLEGKAN